MDAADFATADLLRAPKRFDEHRKAQAAIQARPSATECADCGEPIPQRRRELIKGVQLCTECKSISERRA